MGNCATSNLDQFAIRNNDITQDLAHPLHPSNLAITSSNFSAHYTMCIQLRLQCLLHDDPTVSATLLEEEAEEEAVNQFKQKFPAYEHILMHFTNSDGRHLNYTFLETPIDMFNMIDFLARGALQLSMQRNNAKTAKEELKDVGKQKQAGSNNNKDGGRESSASGGDDDAVGVVTDDEKDNTNSSNKQNNKTPQTGHSTPKSTKKAAAPTTATKKSEKAALGKVELEAKKKGNKK